LLRTKNLEKEGRRLIRDRKGKTRNETTCANLTGQAGALRVKETAKKVREEYVTRQNACRGGMQDGIKKKGC